MIVVQVKFSVVTIDDVDVTLMIWQCPCLYDNENMIHDVLPMMQDDDLDDCNRDGSDLDMTGKQNEAGKRLQGCVG